MLSQFAVSGIQFRFIPARMLDARFGVIGNGDFRRSPEELQGVNMRIDPARQILASSGFGEGIAAGTQNGDKERRLKIDFAGLPVIDRYLVSGIIDEQLLSGAVFVP
jgi:hypothetical protein